MYQSQNPPAGLSRRIVTFFAILLLVSQSRAWSEQIPAEVLDEVRQALFSLRTGDSAGAFPKIDAALAKLGGDEFKDDTRLGGIWTVGARIRRNVGKFESALEAAERSVALAKEKPSKYPEPLGQAYMIRAMCQASLGKIDAALESARLGRLPLGKLFDPDTGLKNLVPRSNTCVDLGGAFQEREDFLHAEYFYRLAAKDADWMLNTPKPVSPYTAAERAVSGRAYSALGGFYSRLGDHQRAIPLLLKTAQIRSKMPPQMRGGGEDTLMSLSRSLRSLGDHKNALAWAEKAAAEAAQSKMRGSKLRATGTKAAALDVVGRYDEALDLQLTIEGVVRQQIGADGILPPGLSNNLGWAHLRSGKNQEARQYLEDAYKAATRARVPDSEGLATICFSLAELEVLDGNTSAALGRMSEAMELQERALEQVVAYGSDTQKLAILERQRGRTDFVIGVHFARFPDNEEAARQALSMVLRKKGRLTRLVRAGRRGAGAASDEISVWRSRLGSLAMSVGITDREFADQVAADWVLSLEEAERKSRLDANDGADEPAVIEKTPELGAITKQLGEGEALIEFVIYRPYAPEVPKAEKVDLPLRCGVLVLDLAGRVRSKDLGEYEPLRKLAAEFRARLAIPGNDRHAEVGKKLFGVAVKPWLALVGKSATWRIAPDGQLHLIPFGALPGSDGKPLIESRHITYLGSGVELAEARHPVVGKISVNLFANPEFAAEGEAAVPRKLPGDGESGAAKILTLIEKSVVPLSFPPLAGTLEEAQLIKAKLPATSTFLGTDADEGRFKAQKPASIIHLATHGFFLGEKTIADRGTRGLVRKKPATAVGLEEVKPDPGSWFGQRSLEHPLLKCGLAFSGANHLSSGDEDGILTGMEVLGMDLSATRLVVLSACETGLGDVVEGEGVFGLRQAFRMAGASSLVLSLWRVNDEATAVLMGHFYDGLASGEEKGEALRNATLKLRSDPKWAHPAYWSAFLLSGDDGKL